MHKTSLNVLDVARRTMMREVADIGQQMLETTATMQTGKWPDGCQKEMTREDNGEKKEADNLTKMEVRRTGIEQVVKG